MPDSGDGYVNPKMSGVVDAESTNQVLRGIVAGIIEEYLGEDEYGDDRAQQETAKAIVDTLREQAWIRGPAERRRAMKRFDRANR